MPWWAVFGGGDLPLTYQRIACWALIEEVDKRYSDTNQYIIGVTGEDLMMDFADESENFAGYTSTPPPSEQGLPLTR